MAIVMGKYQGQFSPHTWRCFLVLASGFGCIRVFSTYVEVFLQKGTKKANKKRFLHIRGGVSERCKRTDIPRVFSPHTWRCFSGVPDLLCCLNGFLHIRGGVSLTFLESFKPLEFSPHTWRCFCNFNNRSNSFTVFSTYVEVFRKRYRPRLIPSSFLHIRGGVSGYECLVLFVDKFSPHTWRCF